MSKVPSTLRLMNDRHGRPHYELARDIEVGGVRFYEGDRVETECGLGRWEVRRRAAVFGGGVRVGDHATAADIVRRFTSTGDARLDCAQRVTDSDVRASIFLPDQDLFRSPGWAAELAAVGIEPGDVLVLTGAAETRKSSPKPPARFHGRNVRALRPPDGYLALRDFVRRYGDVFEDVTPPWVVATYPKSISDFLIRFQLTRPRGTGRAWVSRLYVVQPIYRAAVVTIQANDDAAAIDALLGSVGGLAEAG